MHYLAPESGFEMEMHCFERCCMTYITYGMSLKEHLVEFHLFTSKILFYKIQWR